jgi:hypothetical protein
VNKTPVPLAKCPLFIVMLTRLILLKCFPGFVCYLLCCLTFGAHHVLLWCLGSIALSNGQ